MQGSWVQSLVGELRSQRLCGAAKKKFWKNSILQLFYPNASKWKSLSRIRLFETPWTVQSKESSRSEYWSG